MYVNQLSNSLGMFCETQTANIKHIIHNSLKFIISSEINKYINPQTSATPGLSFSYIKEKGRHLGADLFTQHPPHSVARCSLLL